MTFNIRNTRYMQYIAAISATSTTLCIGLSFTWPSTSLPKLQSPESPIGRPINDEEGSWLVSVVLLCSIPGCILGGYATDKFGRRRTILIASAISSIHFILVAFSRSFGLLLMARCIGGTSMSWALIASNIYSAEIAEVDIRGKLSTYLMFLKTSGTLIGLTLGPYISYTSLGMLSAAIPLITFIIFYFMPETAYYLVKINRIESARNCLRKISGRNVDSKEVEDRLILIKETVEKDMENKTSLIEFFGNPKYRFIIFLMFGIKTLQQLSGSAALEGYLQPIIELSKSGIDPKLGSTIIGCIQLPAVYLSSILVDKLGRKPLLITSALGCSFALFGEGTYFIIQDYFQENIDSLTWLPTLCLAMFWIMNPIGILTIPYVLVGELFPTNIKGIAVAFSAAYGATVGFIVSKFFKPLSNLIGIYSVFYIFAMTCLFGAFFVFFFLPETKGKTFIEIQALICGRSINQHRSKKKTNRIYGAIEEKC